MKMILLADCNIAIRETLGQVLLSEHYDVMIADTGHDAAAIIKACRPDLVLFDLDLLDPDDVAAFDLLSKPHPAIPVIAITALSPQPPRAAALGVVTLMEKPLDIPLLLQTIRYYLAESETERADRLNRLDFKTAVLSEPLQGSLLPVTR
jgi:DNA-binding NtrC family response regulator